MASRDDDETQFDYTAAAPSTSAEAHSAKWRGKDGATSERGKLDDRGRLERTSLLWGGKSVKMRKENQEEKDKISQSIRIEHDYWWVFIFFHLSSQFCQSQSERRKYMKFLMFPSFLVLLLAEGACCVSSVTNTSSLVQIKRSSNWQTKGWNSAHEKLWRKSKRKKIKSHSQWKFRFPAHHWRDERDTTKREKFFLSFKCVHVRCRSLWVKTLTFFVIAYKRRYPQRWKAHLVSEKFIFFSVVEQLYIPRFLTIKYLIMINNFKFSVYDIGRIDEFSRLLRVPRLHHKSWSYYWDHWYTAVDMPEKSLNEIIWKKDNSHHPDAANKCSIIYGEPITMYLRRPIS